MSEEQDGFMLNAFGVDLGQLAQNLKEEGSAAIGQAVSTVTQVVQGVQGVVEGAIDGVTGVVTGAVKKVAGAASGSPSAGASGGGTGSFPLGGSVGRGGRNAPNDVRAIQAALGIPADGQCGGGTIAAIEAFQRNMGQAKPDGRVDAGGATERALAGAPQAASPALAPTPEGDPSTSLFDRALQGAASLGGQLSSELGEEVDAAKAFVGNVVQTVEDEADAALGAAKDLGGSVAPGVGTADVTSALGILAYEPGEREGSFNSPGGVEKTSSGLLLFNFGVNKTFIKPEHQRALVELVKTLKLDDPNAETTIVKVSGFTDGVDVEPKNSPLRSNRADAVQIFLQGKGATEENVGTVINTPAGTFLAPNKTREGRARNRAVLIELGSISIDPVPDPVKPKGTKSKKWSLQSTVQGSPPVKPGVAVTSANFILQDRENKKKHLLQFFGFGGGFGVAFPASVSFPSATEFETTVPRDPEEFNGGGAIRSASAGLGIGFGVGDAQLHVSTIPPQIDIGGLQFSLGIEASFVGGTWKIIG